MKTLNDWGLLILRIGTAGLMLPHGWAKMNKLVNGLTGDGVEFYNWLGIGETPSLILTVIGELIAPVLVLLGWYSRWGAALMAITMGVAAFMYHWEAPLSEKEHALLFFFPALVIALIGPGSWGFNRK
ncbi:MAG: DoxX family protein [Flavobacteriales bacterium]